jgi:hypothetical protein
MNMPVRFSARTDSEVCTRRIAFLSLYLVPYPVAARAQSLIPQYMRLLP